MYLLLLVLTWCSSSILLHSYSVLCGVCADAQDKGWEANNSWEEGGIVYSGGLLVHGSSLDLMELSKECKNV